MPAAALPDHEAERLAALRSLGILDTGPEPVFDALVRTASRLCGAPISLISLVDRDRQWFKANFGLDAVSETPRELAFCAHAILGEDVLVVPDASADPRFADNPLVTGAPDIRFYAGAPLNLSNGHAIGTLCVIDHEPRTLSAGQIEALRDISLAATSAIETRLAAKALRDKGKRLAAIVEGTGAATWEWNVLTGELRLDERWAALVGKSLADLEPITIRTWLDHVHPDDLAAADANLQAHLRGETEQYASEVRLRHRDGRWVWVQGRGRMIARDAEGRPEWVCGIDLDISETKRREAALRTSEELLDSTGRIAGVGGWQLDLQSGELIWTAETRRIHGVPDDYVPTVETAIAFYAPEARPALEAVIQRATATGEPWDLELPFIRASGERIWVRAAGTVSFENGAPRRLAGAFQDIDARKRAEAELARLGERTRLATAAGHVGIWELTLPDERFLGDANACAQFGLSRQASEVESRDWTRKVHTEDWERLSDSLARCASGQQPLDGDFRVVWPDGETRHLHLRADAVGDAGRSATRLVGTTWDVTEKRRLIDQFAREKRRAEAVAHTLAESERFLTVITDNLPCMVAYWDRNERCRFANSKYGEWFGVTSDRMLGMSLRDLLGATIYGLNASHIEGVLAGIPQQFEGTIPNSDGTIGHTWAQYLPHADDSGRTIGFFVLVTDITERKRAEIQLRETNEALAIARDRADAASQAKSHFLATMSHEIRTPLNAVMGMLQLAGQTGLTHRQADYISKADAAAHILLSLINGILDYSKIEAQKLALDPLPFNLTHLLRNIGVVIAANVGAKAVEILFDIDPDLPGWIVADRMRLQQVLINLAGNAVKFTERGEIIIAARVEPGEGGRERLFISVSDTGIGISEDSLATIFDSFSQGDSSTARRFGGSGLGLAISQRLVALMGGTISVSSTLGEGSTFSFSIDFDRVEPADAAGATPRLSGLRVLIVDDDEAARLVLSKLAGSLGWFVETAASGDEAIERVAHRPPDQRSYDVILIDWRMPGRDGWEASEIIRGLPEGETPPLVLMITAHGREALERRATRAPDLLDGVLVKPVTGSMLLDTVADALSHRRRKGATSRLGAGERSTPARLAGIDVLVVEDNAVNRQVACELLERQAARVEAASGGAEALDALKAGRRFDIVLMDIQMAGLDGYATARRIRTELGMRDLPIVAMTANALETDRKAAIEAGMDDHVGKPFEIATLVDVILRHVRRLHGDAPSPTPAVPAAAREAAGKTMPSTVALDVDAAVAKLEGDWDLYRRVAGGLSRQIEDTLTLVERKIAAGHDAEVRRGLHTLKGLAAMAGAAPLAARAAEAERANSAAMVALAYALVDVAAPVLVALAPYLEARPPTNNDRGRDEATPPESQDALLSLATLLRHRNMGAVDAYERLRQSYATRLPAAFASLDETMERLDFPAAHALCQVMIDSAASEPARYVQDPMP